MEGWNDPMNLSKFEPTGKLKINLNKRVAFPLNNKSTTESGSSQEPLRELPTIASNIGGEQTSNSSDDKSNVEEIFDTQAARKRVFSTLEESINQLKDSTVQSNVRAKLKNLENEWDSCDVELQKLLVQLVEFVEAKDVKSAGGIQRKIIMKGYNKPWMQGIRQIVFNLETDSSADTRPE